MAIIDGVSVSGTTYGLRDNDTNGGIAPTFSASTAYTAGQYVWYDSGNGAKLYRFTADHAAGAWTGTDATEVKLGNDVSELKSALNNNCGNESITLIPGYYIKTNQATGAAVPLTPVADATVKYAVVDCNAGDIFTINGVGGKTPRLWAFIDSSGNMVSKAGENESQTDFIKEAPVGSAKLILNFGGSSVNPYAFKGKTADNRISDLETDVSDLETDVTNIGSDVSGLKSALYADSTDYTSQIEQGYVYNASVSYAKYSFTKDEQEDRACYSFTATAGDEIVYSGRTTSSSQRPLYAVRENGALVTTLYHNVGYDHQVVSITEDCTVYVNFNTNANEAPYILKRKPIFNTLTTYQEAEVQNMIDSQPQDIDVTDLMRGYKVGSEFGAWSLGYYNSSLEAKSDTKYAKISKFDSADELVLITKKGYFIQGGYKLNGVTKYDTRESSMRIPSNVTNVSISVSKMPYGDETRPDITVEEAESSLLIVNLTPTSDYYRYKGTFFGFEMYNRVAFVGDSYTQKRATYNKAWGQIIGQKTGIDVALFGHSGYTTNSFINATGSSDSLSGMLAATACDLYWLGFGINDAAAYKANPEYLGSVEDLSGPYTDYPNTFWGNYGRIIESIQATFPSAKIVICGCIYNSVYNAQVGSNTTRIAPINAAIAEIAEHYSIPSISLYDDVFYLSPEYDKNMQATAYTHPDPIIFPGMANANMRLFSKCVADNPEYFRTSTAE